MFRSQHFVCDAPKIDSILIECVLCRWCVANPTSGIYVLLLIATMRLNSCSFGYRTDVASTLFFLGRYIRIEFLNLVYQFHLN